MSTNEKLATLQDDLEHRVQRARDDIQEDIQTLRNAAAEIGENPGANLGWIVSLATTLRSRATDIEQAALRAQDAQEMLGNLKNAIK